MIKKLIILIIINIIIKLIIFNYYHIKKILENQIVKSLNLLILKQEKKRNLEKYQRSIRGDRYFLNFNLFKFVRKNLKLRHRKKME